MVKYLPWSLHHHILAGSVSILPLKFKLLGLFLWLREQRICLNAEDLGSTPLSGRSPRTENGNPLQYSRLENSMDRGAWWATVHGITKSWTQLSG